MARQRCILVLALLVFGGPGPSEAQEAFTLRDLIRIGRERNPTVLALTAEHAALNAHRTAVGRWENPELEYEWGSGDPRDGGPSRSLSGFSFRQVLENPFTRHYRLASVKARAAAAGEAVRSGVLDVEFEIRMHFYRILYLRQMVELSRLNEEALAEIQALIETRARVGEVRELEAIRLRVEHMRAQNEMEAVGMELEQYRRHLNTFLGDVLPEGFRLEGSLEATAGVPSLDSLAQEVLPGHPDLVRAAMEKESALKALRESKLGWLPDPVLSGSSRKELDGEVRSLGVALRIPIWDQSRAAADEDRQRVSIAEHREEAVRLDLEANLMIHHNHLRLSRQTLRLFEEGLLQEAEASMEIAESSYRQGEISFMDYLDARRTYHSIQIQRQQALFAWKVDRARLDRAAGGGTL